MMFSCRIYDEMSFRKPPTRRELIDASYTLTTMVSANDVQRLFLQGVFSRSILSFKHAQVLWEKCIDTVKGTYTALTSCRSHLTFFSCKPDIGYSFF